jgi:hypothetical protein
MPPTTVTDEDIRRFKRYLQENGATWPKIDWPSHATASGSRGAVATDDIVTDEPMLQIPVHLMMSPPAAYASDIGPYLRENKDVIRPDSDVFLAVFLMSERRKGASSFYYPFLKILPEPGSVAHWADEELRELQDEALQVRARGRTLLVESTFRRTVGVLSTRHPDVFPPEEFTLENYKFCWYSIMARAFGKRLPWTAMVPFADCLNHANVQTKYDYNVDGNGLFRLFPTGYNAYLKGSEVFNSYGRRPNDNLLLDYGFAMVDNEWDRVEIMLSLPEKEALFETKRRLLYDIGKNWTQAAELARDGFPVAALDFLRIAALTGPEIDHLDKTLGIPDDSNGDGSGDGSKVGDSRKGAGLDGRPADWFDRLSKGATYRAQRRRCYGHVMSVSNELSAVKTLRNVLESLVAGRVTTVEEDEALLEGLDGWDPQAREGEDKAGDDVEEARWRRQCAIVYRLTRKRVVDATIHKLDVLVAWLRRRLERGEAQTPSSPSPSPSPTPSPSPATASDTVGPTDGAGGVDVAIKRGASLLIKELIASVVADTSHDEATFVDQIAAAAHADAPSDGGNGAPGSRVPFKDTPLELEVYARLLCNPTLPNVIVPQQP